MRHLCITVDFDRDVNIPLEGHVEAGSIDRGNGVYPRFQSTARGLTLFTDLFDELGLPATFFVEGRALSILQDFAGYLDGYSLGIHGLDHEDYTSIGLDESVRRTLLAKNIIKDISGTSVKSFRAPYMKAPNYVEKLHSMCGLTIDSSAYASGEDCKPHLTGGGVTEFPVLSSGIAGLPRSSYLWPLHEGKWEAADYLSLFSTLPDESTLVLSDHTWHIIESRQNGLRSEEGISSELSKVRILIEGLLDLGFIPDTMAELSRP